MRKTITLLPVYNWVKNVYSLCVQRGYKGVYSFTPLPLFLPQTLHTRVKPLIYTHFLASFTPVSYTVFFSKLPLLTYHLFTLSTLPTITKTN